MYAPPNEMTAFSPRNLKYMRAFAEAWPDEQIVQQVAPQIPWFHNCVILDGVKSPAEREWYIRATIQNGWSRNVLVHQIESGLYRRQGKAPTNFTRTLPAPQSELAQQVVKDPYNFEFLILAEGAKERDLEGASLAYVKEQEGHSSIQVTAEIYGHLIPGSNIGWVDALDVKTTPGQSATPAQPTNPTPSSNLPQVIEMIGGPTRT